LLTFFNLIKVNTSVKVSIPLRGELVVDVNESGKVWYAGIESLQFPSPCEVS
jgi:hypothetical protein